MLGVAVVGVFLWLRRRGAPDDVLRPVAVMAVLVAGQGVVGGIQYALEVPAEIVWVHVALAVLTWLALLWSVAAAGQPASRQRRSSRAEEAAGPAPAHVGAVLGGSGA